MNLIENLNIEYIYVNGDNLEAKMNITQFHSQPFGYLHGGATIAFGETIAGYASKQKIEKNQVAVGQTVTANHMKPKKTAGYVMAKGKLMHKGHQSHVWSIDILDEHSRLISHVTVTNAIIQLHQEI